MKCRAFVENDAEGRQEAGGVADLKDVGGQ